MIHEGLRIFPPGSQGFPRTSPGLSIDDYWIPEGVSDMQPLFLVQAIIILDIRTDFAVLCQTEVYTSAWTVTHDPQYFHDPEKFLPERWLDPECTDLKEASQPFSMGSRACLGRKSVMPVLSQCRRTTCHDLSADLYASIAVLLSSK